MFKLVNWDTVLSDLRIGGLLLLSIATVVLVARVATMRRDEVDKLGNMPLDD